LDIKPIRTKADYRAALKDVESLMTAKANTPEGDRLDVLATLIEAYERAHFPMDLPDAVDAIKFRMEQSGLTVEDLEPVIGRAGFASETQVAPLCQRIPSNEQVTSSAVPSSPGAGP